MAKIKGTLAKNIETYQMYIKAFKYFGEEIKELKRPTIKSVKLIKKQWKALRKQLKEEGYIDIPTIKEIAKEYDNRRTAPLPNTEENRRSYGRELIDNLRAHITQVFEDLLANPANKDKQEYINASIRPKYLECMTMLDSIIEAANYDYDLVADVMKANPDFEMIMTTSALTTSEAEKFFDACIEYFTAIMVEVLSIING